MHYKTMILEMLEQRPMLHEQLRSSGDLSSTMDRLAIQLRDLHLEAMEQVRQAKPNSAKLQVAGEAIEIALQSIETMLPPEETNTPIDNVFWLDEAIDYVNRKQ